MPTPCASHAELTIARGRSRDFLLQVPDPATGLPSTRFLGSDTLATALWAGDDGPILAAPTTSWVDVTTATFRVSFVDATTGGLEPGPYWLETTATRSGRSGDVFRAKLRVLPSTAPPPAEGPDDLATIAQVRAAVRDRISGAHATLLPQVLSAASGAIRRRCGGRDFVLRDYDRTYRVDYDGTVFLDQLPVRQVSRVAAGRTTALQVRNADATTNQRATVALQATPEDDFARSAGVTASGITLVRVASGQAATGSLSFGDSPTVAALAAAIADLGGGWEADVQPGMGPWPCSELIVDDAPAQGALDTGCALDVWAEDLPGCRFDRRTGILQVGTARALGIDGPRWGPDWEDAGGLDRPPGWGRVRVLYTAGYDAVPAAINLATIELAKAMVERLAADTTLRAESDGAYSYTTLASTELEALPRAVRQAIEPYRIHRA